MRPARIPAEKVFLAPFWEGKVFLAPFSLESGLVWGDELELAREREDGLDAPFVRRAMRPFTVNAPTPRAAASRAASTTFSECAISISVGRNTALASAICVGWMQLLPR